MAMGVTAVLLAGMGAALVVTVRAADGKDDPATAAAAAASALEGVRAELATAVSVASWTPSRVEFTVPDRDGDGAAETIAYTWGGAGSALRRSYNGSAPSPVVADVRAVRLLAADRAKLVRSESAASTLVQHDPSGAADVFMTVNTTASVAQYVLPTLPADAYEWSVRGLRLWLQPRGAADGAVVVMVTPAPARTPVLPAYCSVVMPEALLPAAGGWVTVPIPAVTGIPAGQGVCVVLGAPGGTGDACQVRVARGGTPALLNAHEMAGNGALTSWSGQNDLDDLRFSITGTVTKLVEP